MRGWQRLALGFAIGGALVLLVHPRSRTVMTYSLQPERVGSVLRANALVSEPLEMFPPVRAAAMKQYERRLVAFRIARRLNQRSINAAGRDLLAAQEFVQECSALEADNAYWSQLEAALMLRSGQTRAAHDALQAAMKKTSWSTGVAELADRLWMEIGAAETVRLAWQGLKAGSYADASPMRFIGAQLREIAMSDILHRFIVAANADLILKNATTFADGRMATSLINIATFKADLPIKTYTHPQVERIRAAFAVDVSKDLGDDASRVAQSARRTVESWEGFVQPAETQMDRTIRRLRLESAVTAALPSALLFASMLMAVFALFGKVMAQLFEHIPHPDARLLVAFAAVAAGLVFWKTGGLLVAMWVAALGLLVGLPVQIGRPEPLPLGTIAQTVLKSIGVCALGLLVWWYVTGAPPFKYLMEAEAASAVPARTYQFAAFAVLSLCLLVGALLARMKERGVLASIGVCAYQTGIFAVMLGLFATTVLTPLCLYRDAQNRALVQQWITSERDLFRVDAE